MTKATTKSPEVAEADTTNPRAVSAPLVASTEIQKVVPGSPEDANNYAEVVRSRARGHYDGVREVGDVFANDRNLPTYPEDPNSWIEDADRPADWEAQEKAAARSRR